VDVLSALLVIVISLVGLDLAAVSWGVDSRDSIGDDHVR
jgi:hypothetical protein